MLRVLVYLANGVQGGAVARMAAARGYLVRALVRDVDRSACLAQAGMEIARADFDDVDALRAAHANVDYVIMQLPLAEPTRMERWVSQALAAIKPSSVRGLIVKMASARPLDAFAAEPSFMANRVVEYLVRESRVSASFVRPTMYLDNLLKPQVLADIRAQARIELPIAADQRVAWTSVDDAARAALQLLDARAFGQDHLVAGAAAVTGAELASTFSQVLDREFDFASLDLNAFEREIDARMGAGQGRRVVSKFRYFEAHPAEARHMLARTFEPRDGLRNFEPTPLRGWIEANAARFAPAPEAFEAA